MHVSGDQRWLVPFALIYLTFFLDNVLLTVLVPIIPDWIRGESVSAWTSGESPLAAVLNASMQGAGAGELPSPGAAQAAVGIVLSAKAGVQLLTAGPAAAAVCRVGAARVLRLGTALLLLAAIVFGVVSARANGGGGGGWGAGAAAAAGRAAQGAGAAMAGVAGLALAATAAPPHRARQALAALLGAVALGVLVGYPFGGATYALWSRSAPFLIIALALALNLLMQYKFLDKEEYNRMYACTDATSGGSGWSCSAASVCRGDGVGGAAAGAVLLTTCVMAALEPTLPMWIADTFHTQRWVGGVVFVPDSAAYLASTTLVGAVPAGGAGARARLAVFGVLGVALAALAIPHAKSVSWLAWPHTVLGLGLGATDAALVPALLAPAPHPAPRRTPHRAALIQAAASAAYVIGPVWGGLCSWVVGFPTTLRSLGVANLLYAALLYRTSYTAQWEEEDEDDESTSSNTSSSLQGRGGARADAEGVTLQLKHTNYATIY